MRTAIDLVLVKGYEGLMMRDVAAKARVSTRTLYNHFPSKEHLLLAALLERGEAFATFAGVTSRRGSPAKRVRDTLARYTNGLQAAPPLTTAMTKALVCGHQSVIPLITTFRDSMIEAIATAIDPDGPTDADRTTARALQRIWFAALVAWSSGIEPPESVDQAITEATTMLLPTNK